MAMFPIGARRTRALAACLLALEVMGCAAWRPETGAPGVILAAKRPDKIRVNLGTDSTVVVARPVIDGDTLRGQDEHAQHSIAIPLADVKLLETRQTNQGAAIALGVGLAGAVALIVFAATYHPNIFGQ